MFIAIGLRSATGGQEQTFCELQGNMCVVQNIYNKTIMKTTVYSDRVVNVDIAGLVVKNRANPVLVVTVSKIYTK